MRRIAFAPKAPKIPKAPPKRAPRKPAKIDPVVELLGQVVQRLDEIVALAHVRALPAVPVASEEPPLPG